MFPYPSPLLTVVPSSGGGGAISSAKWRLNIKAESTPSNWITVYEVGMYDTVGGTNQCTGGSASSSLDNGHVAANAFDGNRTTFWQTGSSTVPQWIEYDFPGSHGFQQISVDPGTSAGSAGNMPVSFDVEYWNGSAFAIYWSDTTQSINDGVVRKFPRYDSTKSGYCKWRLNITATTTAGNWINIGDIEFRETSGGADATAPNGGNGGGPLWSNYSSSPENAFDTSTTDQWQSGANPPQWIGYHFERQLTILEVAITVSSGAGTASPKTFDVQFYDPVAAAWTTSWSVADAGAWTNGVQKVFTHP